MKTAEEWMQQRAMTGLHDLTKVGGMTLADYEQANLAWVRRIQADVLEAALEAYRRMVDEHGSGSPAALVGHIGAALCKLEEQLR